MVGDSPRSRKLALLAVAWSLVALLGCGSLNQADAEAAQEDLAERIGNALKNQDPRPPDAVPLMNEYLAKSGGGGPWSLADGDPLVDRVNPAPGEKAPAPGDP